MRNAGNGLTVGETQNDELKKHSHYVPDGWVTNTSQLTNEKYETNNVIRAVINHVLQVDNQTNDNGYIKPALDNPMAEGGNETRPKSLILKLCIKALNSFDGVQFWIKSHGAVINIGELDAGRLAQGLADKADVVHTHNTSQIVDFDNSVNQLISQFISREFTQSLAESGWYKFPGGLILQWGKFNKGWGNTSEAQRLVTFPISFPRMAVFVGLTEFTRDWSYTTTVQSRDRLTKTGFYVLSQRNDTMYFAIGF